MRPVAIRFGKIRLKRYGTAVAGHGLFVPVEFFHDTAPAVVFERKTGPQ